MTIADYATQLSPELALIVGACIAFLTGVSRNIATRSLAAPIAFTAVLAAIAATAIYGRPIDTQLPGLQFTTLTQYIRWITLLTALPLILVNWKLPVDGERGEFFGLLLTSVAGLTLTAAANDLIVLFLAIELVSVPTYILVALSRTDTRASEASVKYFFLGALSAAIFAYGLSFLYGAAGTTLLISDTAPNLADSFASIQGMTLYGTIGLLLAFAGLSFKIGAVPFHAYVPDVYEGAASPVTGLLGFLPKLAGFVAIIKLLTICNWNVPDAIFWLIWTVAALTMTVGNVLALLQTNVKRMLAYSSVAHSGYMLIGLLVGPAIGEGPMHDGIAAMLFYVFVYGLMNLGAFAVLSALSNHGEDCETLRDLSGLIRRTPALAIAMVICVFSLMGFPPTAGFLGKVYIFSSAVSVDPANTFHQPLIILAVIGVINSAIAAAYYLRIVSACVMGDSKSEQEPRGGAYVRLALGACSLAMILLFIMPSLLANPARSATTSLTESGTTTLAGAQTGGQAGAQTGGQAGAQTGGPPL